MEQISKKKKTVKGRITLFSVIMVAFMIVIAVCGLFSANQISNARKDRYNNYAMSEYYLSEAFTNFCNIKVRVRNIIFMYYNDAENLADQKTKIENYKKAVSENLGLFKERMVNLSPEIQTQYQDVENTIEEWYASTDQDISMAESGKPDAAAEDLMNNGRTIADQAEAELAELVSLLEEESDENNTAVERELVVMTIIQVVATVAAVLIAFLYSMKLIKGITVPVQMLSEAARKLSEGDIEVNCTKTSDDDLGVMVDNFNVMVQTIKDQAGHAMKIAEGDMTARITPRSEKDVLGRAIKKLAENQDRVLSSVKESAAQVHTGADQVASASQMLAQGSTEQASALQQVTASISMIAEETKKNAANAVTANDLVKEVEAMAVDGKTHMQSMVDAMNEISASSQTVSKIIKTIDDISFQTNILALNAAVEAARAGVHGKGFGVVAEEVRSLASKSASAAKETADMIEDSIRKVGNGQNLANVTSESLDKIVGSIHNITELVGGIAQSSNEQATSVVQIDQAIEQVSTVVQTNSATSEECAAASAELSNQAEGLMEQMEQYNLSGDSGNSAERKKRKDFRNSGSNNEQIISLDGDFGKY